VALGLRRRRHLHGAESDSHVFFERALHGVPHGGQRLRFGHRDQTNYVAVGTPTCFFMEDFDSGAAGWTHGGTHDEWQVGPPQHYSDDPASAYSTPNVYGIDLSTDGAYEDDSSQRLNSPTIDCTGKYGVRLHYKRWLAVEDGVYDRATITVNGIQVYVNPPGNGENHTIDTSWQDEVIDISSIANNNPTVRVRFELASDPGLHFGGWNIDDFCVEGIGGGPGTEEIVSGAGAGPSNAPVVKTWSHASRRRW